MTLNGRRELHLLARGDGALAEEGGALCLPAGLAGVMHAGGVLRDATVGNQSAGRARAVFAPKVAGLARLAGWPGLEELRIKGLRDRLGLPPPGGRGLKVLDLGGSHVEDQDFLDFVASNSATLINRARGIGIGLLET